MPNKDKFYLQGKDTKEIFSNKNQIKFDWNIIYACNYRCSYCFFAGKWEEYGPRTVYISVEKWLNHWKRIYRMYGRCSLGITGGEPFIYPDFIELIEKLSEIHHPINISTNSSGDLKNFVKKMDTTRVSLTLSFQPEFDKIEIILEKIKFLRKNGFNSEYINLCAYPSCLKKLDEYIEKVNLAGEKLKVIPFYGEYDGITYPQGYTQNEKEELGLDEVWEKNVKRKGMFCAAGQKSALIFPDGKVARCGQIGEKFLIGNFFSENFKLLNKPLICESEFCPCLEIVLPEEH